MICEFGPMIGCVDSCTHIISPSGFQSRNSNENGVPAWRERVQAASAADLSAGRALTHGATPVVTGASPRARRRKASLALVSRASTSVSKTPIGRDASERSISLSCQVGICIYGVSAVNADSATAREPASKAACNVTASTPPASSSCCATAYAVIK